MAIRPFRTPPQRQRGATAVFAAVAIVAMLTATMLVIEVGRLYSAQRNLAKLAHLTALDAAREVGGCDAEDVPDPDAVSESVDESLLQQGLSAADLEDYTRGVLLGLQTSEEGIRLLDTEVDSDDADAVAVTLTRAFPEPLLPIFPSDGNVMVATAYARQSVVGQIKIGTALLTVDNTIADSLNATLGPLLDPDGSGGPLTLTLSAVDYQGLLNANVTLQDLIDASPGVATPGDLLELGLTLPAALALVGDALSASDEPAEAAVAGILGDLAALADPDRTLTFGELIVVEDAVESLVADAPINVLDLVTGLAQLGAEAYLVEIPLDGLVSIPGIADISAGLRVGQAPQIAVGRPGYRSDSSPRTVARSAQVRTVLDVALLDLAGLLGLPGNPTLSLDLIVEVAQGEATLRRVRCARSASQPYHEATADVDTAAVRIIIGKYDDPEAESPALVAADPLVSLGGILQIGFSGPLIASLGAESERIDEPGFEGPFPDKVEFDPDRHRRHVGDDADAALDVLLADLMTQAAANLECTSGNLLGVTLCAVINPILNLTASVTTLLSPALQLLDVVVNELLQALGISLASADVSIEWLRVDQPYIFRAE